MSGKQYIIICDVKLLLVMQSSFLMAYFVRAGSFIFKHHMHKYYYAFWHLHSVGARRIFSHKNNHDDDDVDADHACKFVNLYYKNNLLLLTEKQEIREKKDGRAETTSLMKQSNDTK